MDDEDIWQDDPKAVQDSEWSRISSGFTNAGYREGITAGKESALQEGFDDGFANIGVPLGRELGVLRGVASALVAILNQGNGGSPNEDALKEAQAITSELGAVRFSDIAPRDLEAEQHALEHLDEDDSGEMDVELNEELKAKRDLERLEDMMARISAGAPPFAGSSKRPTMEDIQRLKERLTALYSGLGIPLRWS